MADEHVLICVAWPYANGPLHLGHVAGCYLPPDIQYRFERAMGNRVLMVSGSDEHGTPITVTAETQGITPQAVVDQYPRDEHEGASRPWLQLVNPSDPRGPEYGGALFNRTIGFNTNRWFKRISRRWNVAVSLSEKQPNNLRSPRRMEADDLPDRYVEGTCPACG